MNSDEKMAVVDDILMRAAEDVGDITQPVLTHFYRAFPQARELFSQLSQNTGELEAEMIEQVLYCLMFWFKRQIEIEILLTGSVPHHRETLNVPTEVYKGLLSSAIQVIANTIPPSHTEEISVWSELDAQLGRLIETSSVHSEKRKA